MDELMKQLQEHSKFDVRKFELPFNDSPNHMLLLSRKDGNKELELGINKDNLSFYKGFNFEELDLLNDFVGLIWKKDIYILITNVSFSRIRPSFDKNIEIKMNYKNNNLRISIGILDNDSDENILISSLRGRGRAKSTVIKISDFTNYDENIFSEDIRCITDSVLFDISSNFRLHFEPISLDDYYRVPLGQRKIYQLPDDVIEFSYKNYIPDLIGYYRNAEKVNYIPFRFLCYYSILEYFLDKSAYYQVSKGIKSMLLKPDFHLNIDYYVNNAVKLIKKENEKHLTDKIKINRVFRQYIDREELIEYLKEINTIDYFTKDKLLKCSTNMNLIGINFENDNQFYDNLTTRIYRLRCSIVHSNPDFDEDKAIPFLVTNENLAIVRQEIILIEIIAKIIILNSAI